MKQTIILAFLGLSTFLNCAEPSAFGAGDLDNPNPYGLTKSEKVILETKKTTLDIKDKSIKNSDSIESLKESIEGFKSVFEGTNQAVGNQKKQISEIETSLKSQGVVNERLQAQIDELKTSLEVSVKTSEENFENFKKIMTELSSLVDSINNNYISKSKYKEDMDLVIDRLNKISQNEKKSTYEDVSGSELIDDAIEAFRQKEYGKSESMFLTLIEKNYKPARSNYYLGEIYYYQNRYKDAIARYKESIGLYDKATYTPTLLLHTAISFQNLKDTANANKFFDVLKTNHPDSNEASMISKYKK